MDDIVNTFEDAQYEQAVTADKAPTSPWETPTPEEAEAFATKKGPAFKSKEEASKNRLGEYLVKELGGGEWEGSPQQTEYMTMQWIREKKVTLSDFREFRTLGRGGFGLVTGVSRRHSGSMFANKIQNKLRVKDGRAEKLAIAERQALCLIDSPFCVKVHYAFHDKLDLYLVMELLSGGDLKYHLAQEGKFTEPVAQYFLACTLQGIGAIHDIGYVYRDLKPENILISSEGHCKISDLGLAAKVGTGISGSAGTRGFWSPEMITKDENGKSQKYDFRVDFWSFGCVAYAFLDGMCPFYHKRINELYGDDTKVAIDEATKKMPLEYGENFTDNGKSFCAGLLTRDPDKRLGSGGWKDIEKHPFFAGYDFETLLKGEVKPPYVPKEALNANSQDSIGSFDKAKKTVVWNDEDEAKFSDWEFTHESRFYDEVIESLEWAKEEGHTDLRYAKKKSSACMIL
jgi:serine/threonine protein kinase